MRLSTRVITGLGSGPWATLGQAAAAADILRETGPRYAVRRWEEQRRRRGGRDRTRPDAVYRRIWGEAAAELGAEMLELFDDFLELRKDGAVTRVWKHWVMLDDAVTLRLALDKAGVHRLLADRGLPVPVHREFDYRDLAGALGFLRRLGGPAVIKPAAGTSSGSAVTSGVTTVEELLRARLRAARHGHRMLIEQQAAGDMYRLLFCDAALLGAVRRRVPRLLGDGGSTVAQLIASENERRMSRPGGTLLTVDLDALLALRRQGLSLHSMPRKGARVAIKGIASQNAFEDNNTVKREALSEELIEKSRAAVDAVGLRLGGVDVITPDPGRPLVETGGVVLEVNGTPGLHYHYQVADPAGADRVAVAILARLLSSAGTAAEPLQIN